MTSEERGMMGQTNRAMADLAAERAFATQLVNEPDTFAAEWTREVTSARRAAWNEGVRALPKGHGPASVIARLGFRMEDLKRAVALHNL